MSRTRRVCKLLQQSENTLTATDAYWLGTVDEVLGSRLPCARELVENAPAADEGSGTKT
jgi:hypothetical protein